MQDQTRCRFDLALALFRNIHSYTRNLESYSTLNQTAFHKKSSENEALLSHSSTTIVLCTHDRDSYPTQNCSIERQETLKDVNFQLAVTCELDIIQSGNSELHFKIMLKQHQMVRN